MAFIGNTVQNQGFTPAIDYFNGNGVTVTFTLSRPIASVAQVIVAVDNVIQNPSSAFNVVGNSITFTSAPLSGTNNIWVEYTSLITTYQGISQDPTVIGDIRATGGYLAEGDFGNSFVDGAILDYVTGAGRVTVGELDDLIFYHGGTAGRSEMMKVSYAGNSTLEGKLTATGNGSFQGVYIGRGTGAISTNTVVGNGALRTNTTGALNAIFGLGAGDSITTGSNNSYFGGYAGAQVASSTGSSNSGFGYFTLASITSGANNTAVGQDSLRSNTTASNNTAVGYQAGYSNATSPAQTFIGYQAGFSATNGGYSTAVGEQALRSVTNAGQCVAIGRFAMKDATTAEGSVAVGNNALQNCAGIENTAVGFQTGYGITTGARNTCIGSQAGYHTLPLTTGINNTLIGAYVLPSSGSAENQICLGYDVVCIGNNYFTFGKSGNRVYNEFTANASWTRSSDVRLKKDINTNTELGLSFINDLRTVNYKWKAPSEIDAGVAGHNASITEADYKNKMYGFIAQEVKEALDKNGVTDFAGWHVTPEAQGAIQGVSYEMFVVPLVKAIQEQQQIINDLKARIEALEAK